MYVCNVLIHIHIDKCVCIHMNSGLLSRLYEDLLSINKKKTKINNLIDKSIKKMTS